VAVAGNQRAVMALQLGERPKAVHLWLEEPLIGVERLRDAEEPHRGEW
jgi:hypothetical protein